MFDALRKRTLGVLALGAAVSMALAACGGTTGTTQPSASINRTGTITIWHG